MSEPLVCAIMLTADRHEMAARAIRCFLRQTLRDCRRRCQLFIFDTGSVSLPAELQNHADLLTVRPDLNGKPIGYLRNAANQAARNALDPDFYVHWDDDDVSAPTRIERQLQMQSDCGQALIGFRSLPFFDELNGDVWIYTHPSRAYALGTSLFYAREVFESLRFVEEGPIALNGSDTAYVRRLAGRGRVQSFVGAHPSSLTPPEIVATLHANSTSSRKSLEKALAEQERTGISGEWKRAAPDYAEIVRNMVMSA